MPATTLTADGNAIERRISELQLEEAGLTYGEICNRTGDLGAGFIRVDETTLRRARNGKNVQERALKSLAKVLGVEVKDITQTSIGVADTVQPPDKPDSTDTVDVDDRSIGVIARNHSTVIVHQYYGEVPPTGEVSAASSPSLDAGTKTAQICPYRGLETFRRLDARFFAGRAAKTEELLVGVEEHRLVGLVAASGAGKSSLVQAGLIPALEARAEEGLWDVFAFAPGREPLKSLSRSMAGVLGPNGNVDEELEQINRRTTNLRSGEVPLHDLVDLIRRQRVNKNVQGRHEVLFFVDQWEELYTQVDDPEQGEALVRELIDVVERGMARLLLTMRADFLGEMLERDKILFELLKPGLQFLSPMSEVEIREAIEVPSQEVGLGIQEGLAERLIADTRNESGYLPYLQFALRRLWEHRDRLQNRLTIAAYNDPEKLGGLKGAIGKHARSVLQHELTEAERALAKAVLPRLVHVSGQGSDISIRQPLAAFGPAEQALLRKLAEGKSRLVVLRAQSETAFTDKDGQTTETLTSGTEDPAYVEVAHEALLRDWEDLRDWVSAREDFLVLRGQLDAAAASWRANGEDPDYLIPPGKPLTDAEALLQESLAGEISDELKDHITASQNARDRDQKTIRTRQRWIFGSAVAACIAMAGLTGWAFQERNESQTQELVAQAAAREALGRQLGAEALLAADDAKTTEAVIDVMTLAAEGWFVFENLNSYLAAHRLENSFPKNMQKIDGRVTNVALIPNSEKIVFSEEVWQSSGQKHRLWTGHFGDFELISEFDDGILDIAVSKDGRLIFVASGKNIVFLDGSNKNEVLSARLEHAVESITQTDDQLIAITRNRYGRSTAVLVDKSTGSARTLTARSSTISRALSADSGNTFMIAAPGGFDSLNNIGYSAEPSRIQFFDINSANEENEKNIYEDVAKNSMESMNLSMQSRIEVTSISYHNPSESYIVGYGEQGFGLGGDLVGGLQVIREPYSVNRYIKTFATESRVRHIAASDNGATVAVATDTGSVRFFDVENMAWADEHVEVGSEILDMKISADGHRLLIASSGMFDGRSSLSEYRVVPSGIIDHAIITDLPSGFHNEDRHFFRQNGDGDLLIVSTETFESKRYTSAETEILGVHVSPNEEKIAVVDRSGSIKFFDSDNGDLIFEYDMHYELGQSGFSFGGNYFFVEVKETYSEHIAIFDMQDLGAAPCITNDLDEGSALESFMILESSGIVISAESGMDAGATFVGLIPEKFNGNLCYLDLELTGPTLANNPISINLIVSGNGEALISLANDNRSTFLYNLLEKEIVEVYQTATPPTSGSFGPVESNVAALGYQDGSLEIINVVTGAVERKIQFQSGVTSVEFSPNLARLSVSLKDGTVRFLRFGDWSEVARIELSKPVFFGGFSPTGRFFVTSEFGGHVRIHAGHPGQFIFQTIKSRVPHIEPVR